ncbi:MAG TPA: DUF547 domain-containing protein [Vicinamibacterales bacterium]
MKSALLVVLIALASGLAVPAAAPAQDPAPVVVDPLHRPFDEILDLYVRDGMVYYFALRQERGKFDRYVQSLGDVSGETIKAWPRDRQLAYWINAYNAFVLRTVIDGYPIRGKSSDYPANSIRQIPGSFERRQFRAGGRMLTLDAIEKDVIVEFGDARALLALARGAMGGPRLKSEAFTADRLESQLKTMASELVTRRDLVFVDTSNGVLSVNALFSWREAAFSKALAAGAPAIYASRSPLEKAVLALIDGQLVPTESEFLRKNTFRMAFHDFDWKLNDLTGR